MRDLGKHGDCFHVSLFVGQGGGDMGKPSRKRVVLTVASVVVACIVVCLVFATKQLVVA